MATYEISIYQTNELYNYCKDTYGDGYRARDRAYTYFEGADDYLSDNITVYKPDTGIGAPTEELNESFDAAYPCDRSYTVSYDKLVYWWEDYVDCELGTTRDCDLLLTNANSPNHGRARKSQYACAEGGPHIADLPSSYDERGYTDPYDAMETAMHEFAHCVMDGTDDDGTTYNEHAVGDSHYHDGDYFETMMTNDTIGSKNECDDFVDSPDGYEMRWDYCCESKMEHT